MQPKMCSKCKKNIAVVFITKVENGVTMNEGYCLKCARSLGIPQIDQAVKQMGISDEDLEKGITEAQAIKEGRIVRDTVKQGVLETIFNKDYPIDDLRYVPFTKRKYQFNMGASSMFTDSGVEVPLFQAWISNTYIFEDIEDQYKDEILQENGERKRLKKYPGLKVGDLKEANNNVGNWE